MQADSITELVDVMSQVWRLLRKKIISHSALTFLQRHSLRYLRQNPETTQKEFAHYFGMSASSAAQFIDRLQKLDFIHISQDLKDKRITRLSLSPAGKKEWEKIISKKKKRMSDLLRHISSKDVHDLLRIQKKILSELQK